MTSRRYQILIPFRIVIMKMVQAGLEIVDENERIKDVFSLNSQTLRTQINLQGVVPSHKKQSNQLNP